MPMQRPPPRTLAILAALVAAAGLAFAHALEIWGEMVPCALCLLERWPYRVVIVFGLLAALAPTRLVRIILLAAVLCLLADGRDCVVHVGVEMGWWPSPLPECAAPHLSGGSIADRLASMPARPAMPCDQATFPIPAIPISLAAMNMLFALTFAGLLAMSMAGRSNKR